MDNKIILTIGRQFGSGGREVGQKLAKELGIGYYDKELMALAAKESGLSEEFFEKADEKASSAMADSMQASDMPTASASMLVAMPNPHSVL